MSARLLGFVDAQLAVHGATRILYEAREYARAAHVLRNAIGEKRLVDLMAAGSAMTEEEAIAEALSIGASER